jgi:RNA polymerase sigma-70 factor (ECF subfamily)
MHMSHFNTTQWSVVLVAGGSGTDARAALESLCRTYRPPILAYIRSRGFRDGIAEDLTQSFFERFLESGNFAAADPARGSFRAYLLTAIKHFLLKSAEEARAVKRGGRIRFESIDTETSNGATLAADGENPEQVFEHSWAMVVLDSACRRLRKEAQAAGKGELFEYLRDFLTDPPSDTDYARVAEALKLRRNTVAVSVLRLRHRFRELVRAEVAQTAADRSAFDIELRELRNALGAAAE